MSPLHVPYLGPSQTFVTKTEGVRYITDQVMSENIYTFCHPTTFQYAALLSSVWGLADQDEEPLLSKHDDDIRLDRDNRMVESISRRTGQAVNTFKRRHHSRHSGRRPWHPTHKVNRRVVKKPPSFLSTLNKFSARKGLAPDKNLSPPSKPFRPPGKKPPAKKLRPPSQPYKPPKKFSKRPYLSQEPKPPRKPSISYLAPPEPTPYQVRMSSTTPLSFNSASGTTFISG